MINHGSAWYSHCIIRASKFVSHLIEEEEEEKNRIYRWALYDYDYP